MLILASRASGTEKSIFIGALTATIGGALQAGSVALSMFIVFRFVNGLGVGTADSPSSCWREVAADGPNNSLVGMLLPLVPLYQSEVSPPHSRGMMVGFHGICVTVGYAAAR